MEWLTDKEKRILLSALTREKKVCIEVDKQCSPRETYEVSLKSICESLEYKLYHDGLFKAMEKQIQSELLDKVMQKQRTIIDDDGVMYKVVFLKDIEDMKAEVNQ